MSLQAVSLPQREVPATGFAIRPCTGFGQPGVGESVLIGYAPRMRDLGDEELMQRYANGDASAFETLYPRYRDSLYRYFLRHLGESALANDLYQGCWEKVIRARQSYQPGTPFRAWLFRIAHNHVVDHYRSSRPSEELRPDLHASSESSPLEHATAAENAARFMNQLALLPAEQRDALLLRFESGLGLAQIGQVIGVNAETVKSRLRYATKKLKQALKP